MRHIILRLAAVYVLVSSPAVAAEVKSHPAVTPYAGSVATRRDDDGFRSYSLVTAVDEKGTTDEEFLRTLKVEACSTSTTSKWAAGSGSWPAPCGAWG